MYDENLQDIDQLFKRVNHHRLEVMGVLHEVRELSKQLDAIKNEMKALHEALGQQTSRINTLSYWAN